MKYILAILFTIISFGFLTSCSFPSLNVGKRDCSDFGFTVGSPKYMECKDSFQNEDIFKVKQSIKF